jgi:hypothetical protein
VQVESLALREGLQGPLPLVDHFLEALTFRSLLQEQILKLVRAQSLLEAKGTRGAEGISIASTPSDNLWVIRPRPLRDGSLGSHVELLGACLPRCRCLQEGHYAIDHINTGTLTNG